MTGDKETRECLLNLWPTVVVVINNEPKKSHPNDNRDGEQGKRVQGVHTQDFKHFISAPIILLQKLNESVQHQ